MQDTPSFFDVLVKTIKNEAKSLKKSSELSHIEALDIVSKEYGFNHWKNVCALKGYVVLSFINEDRPVVNSTIFSRLRDSGFSRIDPKSKIGQFIINQRFANPIGSINSASKSSRNSELIEAWEFDSYMSKIRKGLESLDDVEYFIRADLDSTVFAIVFEGQLHDQGEDQPFVTEYDYLSKGES